jgi:ribosomal protein S8
MMSDTVAFTFGRMNPPTQGHQKLVNKLRTVAELTAADPKVYLSHSSSKPNNPIPYSTKVKLCKEAFGDIVQWSKAKHVIEIMQELQAEGYNNVIMVVGSDRVLEMRELLEKYNDNQYFFENISVTSAGGRNPISEGVEGMSASKLRMFAEQNDIDNFKAGLPDMLRSKADNIMQLVRKGMKLDYE